LKKISRGRGNPSRTVKVIEEGEEEENVLTG